MRRPTTDFEKINLNQLRRKLRGQQLRYATYPEKVCGIAPEQVHEQIPLVYNRMPIYRYSRRVAKNF